MVLKAKKGNSFWAMGVLGVGHVSVSVGHVSVRVGFVEPFGNLLGAFESGRFQTPWSVVSKGAQWFPSQKQSSPRRASLALACECQDGFC